MFITDLSLRYMRFCMPCLIEISLSLSQDEDKDIAKLCSSTLESIGTTSNVDVVELIFHTHLKRLPRILLTGDEEEQLGAVLLLHGLVTCLEEKQMKILLSNLDTMESLMQILLAALELDHITMDLLQNEHSLRTVDPTINRLPWKRFKNLRHPRVEHELEKICKIIGRSTAAEIVVDYLLDLFKTNATNCNETIVLLQMILCCGGVKSNTYWIQACLEEFLLDIHWDLSIQADQTTNLEMEEVVFNEI